MDDYELTYEHEDEVQVDYGKLKAVLRDGVDEEGVDEAVCEELLRYLLVQAELDELNALASDNPWPPQYPLPTSLSPSQSMDKLLHWVLLNTAVRKQVEAGLDTSITHSTRTAGLPDRIKVSRQLVTMNIMERLGYPPRLSVWRELGTLMEGTYRLDVQNEDGKVLGTVYVNNHVTSSDTILLEVALRGLQGVSVKWDAARQRWQASSGKPEDSHAEEKNKAASDPWVPLKAGPFRQAATFTVSVKKLTGHRITIACTPDETVEDLKQHIQDKDGIPIDQQRLIFSGKQLEDARELRNCGLSNGCTVHLVGRLRGC